jgi:hypothetical protein
MNEGGNNTERSDGVVESWSDVQRDGFSATKETKLRKK